MFPGFSLSGLLSGTVVSMMVHLGAGGSLYYWFVKREPPPIVAELDLSMSPLLDLPANAGGGIGKKLAAIPAGPEKIQTVEEVVKEEANPCLGNNCSDTGTGAGGGGTGEGEGQYISAENTFRKPRWVKNFISSRDYPLIARQQGKDGRVVLVVLIDSQGKVRDARLLQGSYEVFNEVALRKIRQAEFTPAYSEEGRPLSCKVTLPIRFELR